jgi:hypothetical protein
MTWITCNLARAKWNGLLIITDIFTNAKENDYKVNFSPRKKELFEKKQLLHIAMWWYPNKLLFKFWGSVRRWFLL